MEKIKDTKLNQVLLENKLFQLQLTNLVKLFCSIENNALRSKAVELIAKLLDEDVANSEAELSEERIIQLQQESVLYEIKNDKTNLEYIVGIYNHFKTSKSIKMKDFYLDMIDGFTK